MRRIYGGTAVGAGAPVRRQSFGYGREQWFSVALVETLSRTHTPGTVTVLTDRDAVFSRATPTLVARDYRLEPDGLLRPHAITPQVTLGANSYLAQDATDPWLFRTLAAGPAQAVVCSTPSRTLEILLTPSVTADSATVDTLLEWSPGSLAAHCSAAVDTRLAGKSPASSLRVYLTQDHTSGVYTRNPGLWCADLGAQLTCISPWRSTGNRLGQTAVTRRHTVQAAHAGLTVGHKMRFVTADNQLVERTVSRVRNHPLYRSQPGYGWDLQIALLDADLPESIVPCRVSPDSIESHLPNIRLGVPGLCLDQEEKALVSDLVSLGTTASTRDFAGFRRPGDAHRVLWHEDKIGGDSGNPAFVLVNGQLVLVTAWTFGGGGSGTEIGDQVTTLNGMIATVDAQAGISTGYTVQAADLSAFPSYA